MHTLELGIKGVFALCLVPALTGCKKTWVIWKGILLCAGNKTGNEKRFYDQMIPIADREFTQHLEKKE